MKDCQDMFKVKNLSFKFLCQKGMTIVTAHLRFQVNGRGALVIRSPGLCSSVGAARFNSGAGCRDRHIPALSARVFRVFSPAVFCELLLQTRNLWFGVTVTKHIKMPVL